MVRDYVNAKDHHSVGALSCKGEQGCGGDHRGPSGGAVAVRLPDSLESGSGNLTGADYAVGGAFGNNNKILVIAIKHKARTTRDGLQITTDLFTGPRQ